MIHAFEKKMDRLMFEDRWSFLLGAVPGVRPTSEVGDLSDEPGRPRRPAATDGSSNAEIYCWGS